MKINGCVYYNVVLILLLTPYCTHSGLREFMGSLKPNAMGEVAVKTLNQGNAENIESTRRIIELMMLHGKAMTKDAGESVIKASGNAAFAASELRQGAETAGKAVSEAAPVAGVEAAKQLAGAANAAIVVFGIYPIAKDVKDFVCPTQEQQAREEAAKEKIELIKAKRVFRDCVMKNRLNPDRGATGLPAMCEANAEMIVVMGHGSEVEQITAYFNKCRDGSSYA